jgi:hypothetical protein
MTQEKDDLLLVLAQTVRALLMARDEPEPQVLARLDQAMQAAFQPEPVFGTGPGRSPLDKEWRIPGHRSR